MWQGLGTKAMKVSSVTAMCCFWEGHLLPQISLVVNDNLQFASDHSRNWGLVYYRTVQPGFTLSQSNLGQDTRRVLPATHIPSPPPTGHAYV